MRRLFVLCSALSLCSTLALPARADDPAPAHLPGELSADQVLNGEYPYSPSPQFPVSDNSDGLATDRLGKTPPPGVHPRVLTSPDELPDLRNRLLNTANGKAAMTVMKQRVDDMLRAPGLGKDLFEMLASGDLKGVEAAMDKAGGVLPSFGHYQPYLMALTLEAFRCMVEQDKDGGKKVASAIASYARFFRPYMEKLNKAPLNDDVWRVRIANPDPKNWRDNLALRDIVGYQLMGYAYDYAYNDMTDSQRDDVRTLISEATFGKMWMGTRLPHHFRNWNWVAIGLQTPLLALAIEGEKGYDPRVYKLGLEVARDYLTYGIDPSGVSTEAVGYTQFGLRWCDPFAVAAQRRGDKILTIDHFRKMLDWYMETLGSDETHWISHGDGGDSGPIVPTLAMWMYFFPKDARADFLWQVFVKSMKDKPYDGRPPMAEALLWVSDPMQDAGGKPIDYQGGATLNEPRVFFDPIRSSLLLHNKWEVNAMAVQFECRTDSYSASHEHADRGQFNLSADGRDWAKENFRSIESRHHNLVLIDGRGQGFWPGPGKWLDLQQTGDLVIAAVDQKDAYNHVWPKEAGTEPQDFIRYQFERWKDYKAAAAKNEVYFQGQTPELDQRDSVKEKWGAYFDKAGGPRMWDEDTWPKVYPFNDIQKAFRTVIVNNGANPYMVVADDIQKDDQERLYEWNMQTGLNTEIATMKDNDLVLCDATVTRDENGVVKPKKGDRELLVRVLNMNDPKLLRDYQTRPSIRLETFERKDTTAPDGRTFGLDKRLVIASRSTAPDFKILLVPLHQGDELPVTTWNDDKTELTIRVAGHEDLFSVTKNAEGRSIFTPMKATVTP